MFSAIKFLLYRRFSASHKELMPPWRDLVLSRYEEMQGLGTWNQFLKISTYLKTCSPSLPGAQSALLSILNFQGVSKVSSCSSTGLSLPRGRWQMPLSCCCSVAQLYPTLPNPMNCSTPGLPVLLHLPELALTRVHWVSDAIQPSQPLSPPPPAVSLSESFPMSQFFTSGGQHIGASASASVLPMNIQGSFSLGLTGHTPLSKGLSRVFSSTTIWKHRFFGTQPSYGPTLTAICNYWKNHTFMVYGPQ